MPNNVFHLNPEQKDRLCQLNGMIAYLNYATGCAVTMEVKDSPHMLLEHADGFMLLSAHLTEEVQRVLDGLPWIDGKTVERYASL